MPLTSYQTELCKLLAVNRTEDSHLAGGAALHIAPNSIRYSNDLDLFHDSVERVATAFAADSALLKREGHAVQIEIQQEGYVRTIVKKGSESTKIEWAFDAAWRFMPAISDPICGFRLHPIDLATNKLLALIGRDEPRDFLDIMNAHECVLPLGALCWAAAGKDPGFTPQSILSLLRRRGKYRSEDFARLRLNTAIDLIAMKQQWLLMLDAADLFVRTRPPEELGCLYYSPAKGTFVEPAPGEHVLVHHGRLGGARPEPI